MKRNKVSLLLAVVFVFLLTGTNVFAFSADSVLSHDIKEADGTSGQDTNTGSGVKTGHIQNRAITSAKIGFYSNVVVVAPSGGDFTSPVDALNAITNASATNPYLVKIMPGVYDIGTSSVQMKEYVDIEGSGENTTWINGSVQSGVIRGASNAEIRFLTVQCNGTIGIYNSTASPKITNVTVLTGSATAAYGIYNTDSSSPQITHVKVLASGHSDSVGIIDRDSSSSTIKNSTIEAISNISASYGVYSFNNCTTTMKNVLVIATATSGYAFGVYNSSSIYAGVVYIDHSVLSASTPLHGGAYVSYTKFEGTTINCPSKSLGLYDGNYNPITCP